MVTSVLQQNKDYFITGHDIFLITVIDGDVVVVESYSRNVPSSSATGFYEIPSNLSANADNELVQTITKGDAYNQFSEIIGSQDNFSGQVFYNNNWRKTAQQRNKGSYIIQNSASLLKTMLLCSQSNIDFMQSCRYAEDEYVKFRFKFEQKITSYFTTNKYLETDSLDTWVNAALTEISQGKTATFPFYYSGMGITSTFTTPMWIPATPSFLGTFPAFNPQKFIDKTTASNSQYILNHDGSFTLLYGDIRDNVILQLEKRLYAAVQSNIKLLERPIFDWMQYYSGAFRLADYSRQEWLNILQPSFERWCANNSFDYKINTNYNDADVTTWNWSNVTDIRGNFLPGHWRGIFNYYYDTDRPHTHPWEMLGFANQPNWWTDRYGSAPYTNHN
jgi:hypothetical protein